MRLHLLPGSFWISARRTWSGVLLLALTLVCAACASSTSLSPSETVSVGTPRPLAASMWEYISFPAPLTDVYGFFVSPTDSATIFACTAHMQPPNGTGVTASAPMTLWRTTDAGAHWTRYDPVLPAGYQCLFASAPDDSQRVSLQVLGSADNAHPCTLDSFYLSSNGGATWGRLPPHVSIAPKSSYGSCDLHVTRHHLYLAYSLSLSSQGPQVGMLERSDDGGTSWVRADRGLGDNAFFFMPNIGLGDTLAVTVTHFPAQVSIPPTPIATNLWMSSDAGDTWLQVSTLPQGAGTFLWASWATAGSVWPTANHPFYALEHEQIPSDLYRERTLMSGDGHTWMLLPPLPVSGATADRPGILQALSALPDGRLAIWGPDPRGSVPTSDAAQTNQGPVSAFWLWLWDPATQQWQVLPSPLNTPPTHEGCGLCWQAYTAVGQNGVTYLYVSRLDDAYPGGDLPGMFRVRLLAGA